MRGKIEGLCLSDGAFQQFWPQAIWQGLAWVPQDIADDRVSPGQVPAEMGAEAVGSWGTVSAELKAALLPKARLRATSSPQPPWANRMHQRKETNKKEDLSWKLRSRVVLAGHPGKPGSISLGAELRISVSSLPSASSCTFISAADLGGLAPSSPAVLTFLESLVYIPILLTMMWSL